MTSRAKKGLSGFNFLSEPPEKQRDAMIGQVVVMMGDDKTDIWDLIEKIDPLVEKFGDEETVQKFLIDTSKAVAKRFGYREGMLFLKQIAEKAKECLEATEPYKLALDTLQYRCAMQWLSLVNAEFAGGAKPAAELAKEAVFMIHSSSGSMSQAAINVLMQTVVPREGAAPRVDNACRNYFSISWGPQG